MIELKQCLLYKLSLLSSSHSHQTGNDLAIWGQNNLSVMKIEFLDHSSLENYFSLPHSVT